MFAATVYAYRDRVVFSPTWDTRARLQAAGAPLVEAPASADDRTLGQAAREALAATRTDLPEDQAVTSSEDHPVLRHLGLPSWAAFVAAGGLALDVWTGADSLDDATELEIVPSKHQRGQLAYLPAGHEVVVDAGPGFLGAGVREAFARCQPPLSLAEAAAAGVPDEREIPPERRPAPFGPRSEWLAVRGRSRDEVAAALRLAGAEPASWADGVPAALASEQQVFVAPPVDGWTLAVGALSWMPGEVAGRLEAFSRELGEVQFFGTHRVADYAAWGRAVGGTVQRVFVFTGDLVDLGDRDDAERDLGIDLDQRFPDEDDVLAMAGAWSLDPSGLAGRESAPGGGLLGRLPAV